MTEIRHEIPNPQSGMILGDFVVYCSTNEDGTVDLLLNHNGQIDLEDAGPEETLEVIDGLIKGLQKARQLIAREASK